MRETLNEAPLQRDVIIVGGGLAGIACAVALQGSGLRVTLLEADALLGGRAKSWRDTESGDIVDLGPHILVSDYRNLLALLEILGTQRRIAWQKDKLITLLSGTDPTVMRLHRLPPPLHLAPSMLKTSQVSLLDKLSNARATWLAMSMGEEDVLRLDAEPADELLRRLHVSRAFTDWFWKTASLALMNVPLHECSAGALLRFYAQLMGHNDYRIGFAAAGLSDLFLPEAERLIERSAGEILTGRRARRIVSTNGICSGIELEDGALIRANHCVAAVPPASLWKLLPGEWRRHNEWRDRPVFQAAGTFRASPYISVYLWFDRKLTTEKFWARIWSDDNLNCDFYDLSNIRAGWATRSSVIASNIIHSTAVAHLSDAQVVAATLREIADFAPHAAEARVMHSLVHRIPMSIPCPHPGTEALRPPTETGIEGLLLAGDWTRTHVPFSMESAVRSGFLAAESLWRRIGHPRKLALPLRPTAGFSGLARRAAQATRRFAAPC
jgi:15-cis-phytoene desaturase